MTPKFNPNLHHRRSIRLKNYDYSQSGLYFITICTQNRECLFGEIIDDKINLNIAGKMVENIWLEIPQIFTDTKLHEYIIMPNHFHAIIEIVGADSISAQNTDSLSAHNTDSISAHTGNGRVVRANMEYNRSGIGPLRAEMDSAPTGTDVSLPKIVQTFKRYTTIEYIKMVKQNILPSFEKRIWQRNYYEHIIRDEKSYRNIAEYIINNPLKWKEDDYYVQID